MPAAAPKPTQQPSAISPEDCATLTGYFEAVEASREEVEQTWGAGRVERLAGLAQPDLLAKFRRQQATWSGAYQAAWTAPYLTAQLLETVQLKAAAMRRGWQALADHAASAGHRPIAPWVWEIRLADGSVAALVQTDAEVGKVIAEGRFVSVYTPAEIGHLIDAIPGALQMAKVAWPGAKFTSTKTPVPNTSGASAWSDQGDEIPF
jgi:hypothetical protein